MKELENRSDFHAHITSEEDALTLIDKAIEANVKSIALIGRGVLPDNTDSIINPAAIRGLSSQGSKALVESSDRL